MCQARAVECNEQKEPSTMEITTVGLDIAKRVFQLHGVDAAGKAVLRRKRQRSEVLVFFKALPPCLVGIKACGTGCRCLAGEKKWQQRGWAAIRCAELAFGRSPWRFWRLGCRDSCSTRRQRGRTTRRRSPAAPGRKVRRLSPGGKWIRTTGS